MEALISIFGAVAGLVFLLMFLWDFFRFSNSGNPERKKWLLIGAKLIAAMVFLHLHFNLDIFD